MSTVLFEKDMLQVNRFYGGVARGLCYAVSGSVGYVELTRDEAEALLACLREEFSAPPL